MRHVVRISKSAPAKADDDFLGGLGNYLRNVWEAIVAPLRKS
jgi:hypothetical protein